MKHAPDHLWQRDLIAENAEVRELQRCTAQFKADIRAALLDATEEDSRRAYAGHPQSNSTAYFGQLVERTFSAIPKRILEDATELSTVLQGCTGMLQPAYAKSVFAAVPNTLLAYPAVLDACVSLCDEPLPLFCGLSSEKQRSISHDWFQTFWNHHAENTENSPLRYLPPETLPWSILHPSQVQYALEHIYKNDLHDFSRIPHIARSSALWQQDFQDVFRQALTHASPAILRSLSCWPEEYHSQLRYDPQDLQQYIVGNSFVHESCAPLFAITGETPESVGLQDQALTIIHHILNSPFPDRQILTRVNEFLPYLSLHEQTRIERYLHIIAEGKFRSRDAHIVYTHWNAGEQKNAPDNEMIAAARQGLVQNIVLSAPEHETEIHDTFHAYSSYTHNDPQAESLLWEAIAQIQDSYESTDEEQSLEQTQAKTSAVITFLQSIHKLLQFIHDDDQDILLAMMKFAQIDTASRIAVRVIESLNTESAQDCIETIRHHGADGVLIYYFSQIREALSTEHGPVHHFDHAMRYVKSLRDAQRSLLGKGMPGYAETMENISTKIRGVLRDIRQARDQEHTDIAAIADAVRTAMEHPSTYPAHECEHVLHAALSPLLNALSEKTRITTWSKVQTYIHKRYAVNEYAARYRHDARDLFQKVIPEHHALHCDVEIMTHGMSLAFILDERDFFSDKLTAGTLAYAALSSKIYALSGTIVVMAKASGPYAHEMEQGTLTHENRHQEDRLFFEQQQPLEKAKTEILAHLSEGLQPDEVYEILSDIHSVYTFDIPAGSAWALHCRRLRRALDIAAVVRNLDLLAQKPIQQWRQLLPHPSAA